MAYKLPWMKFYPSDWLQDTIPLSLAERGAWITIVCAMWWAYERGKLIISKEGLGRLLGVPESEALKVIDGLTKTGVCDEEWAGSNSDGVTGRSINITLVCRRMFREYKSHKNNALRQERYRVTHASNAPVTGEKSEIRSQKADTDKSKRTTTHKFIKPTLDQIGAYAKSIGFALKGQNFFDYYEANGWKVGRNPMKSWEATVRTWKNKDYNDTPARPEVKPQKLHPKELFDRASHEVLDKLEEANLAGKDSMFRALTACRDKYRDTPKWQGQGAVDYGYEVFKHRNK